MTELTEKQLIEIDKRLTILSPFTVKQNISKKTLFQKCQKWRQTATESFDDESIHDAIEILGLFILNRFKQLKLKEVLSMLNFNLTETVAGQEIMDIGLGIGKREGERDGMRKAKREILFSQLEKKFGNISPIVRKKISYCRSSRIDKFATALFDFQTMEEAEKWWMKNQTSKKT
ncbi:hypothetical protein MHK_004103 [Candidatus Magnetomorum sp. HK-1]|nr:hypothetical protein MHK_004103 [Candidatus Magnetomorum sp. HK-1]